MSEDRKAEGRHGTGRVTEGLGRAIKRKKEGTASDQSSDSATAGAGSSSCDRGGRKENTDRKSAGRDPGVVLSDLGGRIL